MRSHVLLSKSPMFWSHLWSLNHFDAKCSRQGCCRISHPAGIKLSRVLSYVRLLCQPLHLYQPVSESHVGCSLLSILTTHRPRHSQKVALSFYLYWCHPPIPQHSQLNMQTVGSSAKKTLTGLCQKFLQALSSSKIVLFSCHEFD